MLTGSTQLRDMSMMTREDVLNLLNHDALSKKQKDYLFYHAERLSFLTHLLQKYIADISGDTTPRILDVAPHFTSVLLKDFYGAQIELNTLGWLDESLVKRSDISLHFEFNPNDAQYKEKWIEGSLHDIVFMGEIIEHLYTAPEYVLSFIARFIGDGGLLVIQTPNAVSVRKRLRMMMGKHPYDMLDKSRHGHFREYTVTELCQICEDAGLKPIETFYSDYWPERSPVLRLLERMVPSFKKGLVIVARKENMELTASPEFLDDKFKIG